MAANPKMNFRGIVQGGIQSTSSPAFCHRLSQSFVIFCRNVFPDSDYFPFFFININGDLSTPKKNTKELGVPADGKSLTLEIILPHPAAFNLKNIPARHWIQNAISSD